MLRAQQSCAHAHSNLGSRRLALFAGAASCARALARLKRLGDIENSFSFLIWLEEKPHAGIFFRDSCGRAKELQPMS